MKKGKFIKAAAYHLSVNDVIGCLIKLLKGN